MKIEQQICVYIFHFSSASDKRGNTVVSLQTNENREGEKQFHATSAHLLIFRPSKKPAVVYKRGSYTIIIHYFVSFFTFFLNWHFIFCLQFSHSSVIKISSDGVGGRVGVWTINCHSDATHQSCFNGRNLCN